MTLMKILSHFGNITSSSFTPSIQSDDLYTPDNNTQKRTGNLSSKKDKSNESLNPQLGLNMFQSFNGLELKLLRLFNEYSLEDVAEKNW